jgi:hypothetical protein
MDRGGKGQAKHQGRWRKIFRTELNEPGSRRVLDFVMQSAKNGLIRGAFRPEV